MRTFLTLVVIAALACARPVHADSTRAQAKQHFMKGVELFTNGDLLHALAELEGSYRLQAVPEVLFNIALVQKGLHRYADALRSVERFVREAQERPSGLDPKRRAEAEREMATLRGSMATLLMRISPPTASVLVDGREPDAAEPLQYLDPGPHRVEVTAAGYAAAHEDLIAVGGRTSTVTIDLRQESASPAVSAPNTPSPAGAALTITASGPVRRPVWKRTGFWVGIGAGAAAVVIIGGVAGWAAHRSDGCGAGCVDFR
jgi:hypothetical protein